MNKLTMIRHEQVSLDAECAELRAQMKYERCRVEEALNFQRHRIFEIQDRQQELKDELEEAEGHPLWGAFISTDGDVQCVQPMPWGDFTCRSITWKEQAGDYPNYRFGFSRELGEDPRDEFNKYVRGYVWLFRTREGARSFDWSQMYTHDQLCNELDATCVCHLPEPEL